MAPVALCRLSTKGTCFGNVLHQTHYENGARLPEFTRLTENGATAENSKFRLRENSCSCDTAQFCKPALSYG